MKALIIEDELHASKLLEAAILKIRPSCEIVAVLDSVRSSLNYLEQNDNDLDLIFMDIELADGLSFEIFKHRTIKVPVIFTTAYDQHAVEAFRVNAVDYLLKPIMLEELQRAIDRVEKGKSTSIEDRSRSLKEIDKTIGSRTKNRCLIKKGNAYEFVNVREIALVYSEDSLTFLHTDDGKRHIYSSSIEQFIQELDPEHFFQVNRSQIVRIDNIKQVQPYFGQRLNVELVHAPSSIEVIVSRQRVGEFKDWLDH